nr:glycosyltransferase family 4 protein [Sphingomonas yunnanensis]
MLRNPGIVPALAVPAEGAVASAARREGVEVAIVPFGAVSEIRRPLRPRVIGEAMRDFYRAAAALRRAARTLGADVIHSNGMKAHSIAALARMTGSPPLVIHIHDLPVYRSEAAVWRTLARAATQTIVVSRACWPDASLPRNVTVVHNGFEPAVLNTTPAASPPLTIGFCGRLHPFKGVHLLPDWLAAARDAGIDARLIVRGEAAPEHASYVEAIRARVAALGLDDQVDFEGRREGLEAIFGGLHAVVVPSDTPDPLPRSVMEAMGLGLPVIGYPAGGIPEMIAHGRNGWLVADADGFVAAARVLAAGGAPVEAIRGAALETVQRDLSLPVMYERLDAIYARALQR